MKTTFLFAVTAMLAFTSIASAQLVFDGGPDGTGTDFFDEANWEMLVKVVDGCDFNGHHWVFAAATTNVSYTLTVTDTLRGVEAVYRNPLGVSAAAITDTEALDSCP